VRISWVWWNAVDSPAAAAADDMPAEINLISSASTLYS